MFENNVLMVVCNNTGLFTNNLGENDIRITKAQLKTTGCFNSEDSVHKFCCIRATTCRKQSVNARKALVFTFRKYYLILLGPENAVSNCEKP